MTPETVLTIGQGALQVTTLMILVLLLPALGVGLLVSMFQAATQINEVTLSFVPKLLITLLVLLMAGSWLLSLLMNYMQRLMENVPFLIG